MKIYKIIISILLISLSVCQIKAEDSLLHKRPKNKPLLRLKDFNEQRFGSGEPDNIQRLNALIKEELQFKNNSSEKLLSDIPEWKNIGPFDIAGRVKSIAIDPKNNNIVYIGAAAGGIWKSINAGQSWTPIFDFQNATAFGALCIDPNNSSIIYAATGEMIIGGGIPYLGNGVYKSTDAGNTWFQIGLTQVASFSKIYVHPLNSNLVYASGAIRNGGVYKSTNAGIDWQRIYEGNITDLSVNPQNIDEIFAGINLNGVVYSSDGGVNWENRSTGLADLGGRVSVQAFSEDFKIVYTLFERKDGRGVVYKSSNSGKNWVMALNGNSSFFNEQGYYNNFISIHPKNSNIVLTGGIELWRTTDGGQNWEIVNDRTIPTKMHVDQHCATFSNSENNNVYVGNDGGVFRSTDAGFTWRSINTGLMITQFYAMNLDLKQKNRNFGGTQDNGTLGNPSNSWKMLVGGDGFDCFLHPNNPNILFGEIYYGDVFKYESTSDNYNFLNNGLPDDDIGTWHSPFIFDSKNHTMYLGRNALYVSYNYGDVFFQLTPRGSHQYTAIEPSKKNSRIIYAGNRMGVITVTTDAGITWRTISSPILPGKYITDMASSIIKDSVVYVSYSGYGDKHIFKSTNLGITWLQIDQSLPDIPVNSIILHPENESVIFAGTDIGVYVSYNDGKEWSIYGKKFPRTPIMDLKFHTNKLLMPTLTLRAASYGRSIWEVEVPENIISQPMITAPAGGEVYSGGAKMKTSWYGFEYPVRIEFSSDGNNFILFKDSVFQNILNLELPDIFSYSAKIKVISIKNGESRISNTFSIIPKSKGSILAESTVGFNPYGICFSDNNSLLVVDYRTGSILLMDINNFSISKKINSPVKGLYTDISISNNKDTIFLHKMETENGNGAEIIIIDTLGNLIKRVNSPAKYPMGLAYTDGSLYITDRDGTQKIYKMNTKTFQITEIMNNPKLEQFAPRCITYNNNLIHQVTTTFNSNVLVNSEITVFSAVNGTIIESIPLTNRTGVMNARGVDIDPTDGNYWVSDFNGSIYKIAAGKSTTDINDENPNLEIAVFPNPTSNKISLFFNHLSELSDKPIIYNLLGLTQKIEFSKISDNLFEADITNLPIGVYFISINNKFLKFIKN
jgi:photosystem II stability/assembly factor-like uncharacterized protein